MSSDGNAKNLLQRNRQLLSNYRTRSLNVPACILHLVHIVQTFARQSPLTDYRQVRSL